MNYAERMRNLRQDNDLSQKNVADMLGVAQTTYSQYELEKRPMPIDYLIALSNFTMCLLIICSDCQIERTHNFLSA